ncbi:MAG: hypothetical protein V4459_08515 [Pseudomonadota bacterium]
MPAMRVSFRKFEDLEAVFEEVTVDWGLCASEREAIRGTALTPSGRSRRSSFVAERMALVIEIDWLLGSRMDANEIRLWVRRRVAGVFGSSPLDDMFGSTDRLRRIRAMLALEVSQ